MNDNDIELLTKLGELYSKDETKQAEAEEILNRAITIDDRNADTHLALGKVYERQELVEKAIEQFKLAVKLPKPALSAYFYLGQ